MKFIFFIFLFLMTFSLSCATSLGGSPSSLDYDLDVGEEDCKMFYVSSTDYSGSLYSVMKWAEKNVDANHPNQLVLNATDVNLDISYSPKEINNFDGQEEIEICISGEEVSFWEGVLEYRTESESNIGVGVGVILRVTISDKPKNEYPEKIETSSSGGGGSSSSTNNVIEENEEGASEDVKTTESNQGELEEINKEESASGLTGAAIGAGNFKRNWIGLLVFLVIIFGIVIVFSYKKKKRRKFYGY